MTALFALMCLIWGATWLAMKIGFATLPPLFFVGSRFVAAGLVLLAWAALRGEARRLTWRQGGRLLVVQAFLVVFAYGPLFWASPFVPSGLTATLNLSLIPVCLLVFGMLLGGERWSTMRSAALALGLIGVAALFGHQISVPTGPMAVWGSLAIMASAVSYSFGSVIARPLAASLGAGFLSGLTLAPGGLALVLVSLAVEPGAAEAARLHWSLPVWGAWLFLTVFGSVVAFTIYLRLLQAWGPARAGSYAYVSPVIAIAIGVAVLHERLTIPDAVGSLLMLAASFCSLRARAAAAVRPVASQAPSCGFSQCASKI